MPGLKILVSYHKPSTLLKNNIFVPIHLGRCLENKASKDDTDDKFDHEWLSSNMIGDDTGDNISDKNRELCELTSIYWAWKNLDKLDNPDYIGFMHYRRHLCFNLKCEEKIDHAGLLYSDVIDKEYISKYGLTENIINSVIKEKDIIVGEKVDVTKFGNKTTYDHYRNALPGILHIEDYDTVIDIVERLYPQYSYSIKEYNASQYAYFANIFIMKKELFKEYATWLFSIIFEAEKVVDISNYNIQEIRVLSFISEWLFGIWYTHWSKNRDTKSLELKRTFIRNTSYDVYCDEIFPAFEKNNIPIILSCDKNYVNYLGVTITSIFSHSNEVDNYDILVLHADIPVHHQKDILSISNNSNHSIRFIKIDNLLSNDIRKKFFITAHFSQATYYRFFIPELFKHYDKVVYIDCDLVLNSDISKLYNTQLSSRHLVAAVKDVEVQRLIKKEDENCYWKNYLFDTLKIRNIKNYFNAGVLVFNVKQMIEENCIEVFFKTLDRIVNPVLVDQDILNVVCENRVKFLDLKWNVLYQLPIWDQNWKNVLPCSLLNEYIESRKNPYIIHYAGEIKPWNDPSNELALFFWQHARKTIFYERIIYDNLKKFTKSEFVADSLVNHESDKEKKEVDNHNLMIIIKDVFYYNRTRAKYAYYKILSKVYWGKKRKRYKEKRKKLKEEISRIRHIIKNLR